jgi:hypothetical protein
MFTSLKLRTKLRISPDKTVVNRPRPFTDDVREPEKMYSICITCTFYISVYIQPDQSKIICYGSVITKPHLL